MIATKAIAASLFSVVALAMPVPAQEDGLAPRAEAAGLTDMSEDTRLRFDDMRHGTHTRQEVDIVSALGLTWGEPALRDLLASFDLPADTPPDVSDGYAYLQNPSLGIEITFKSADELAHWVPPRAYPKDALVLINIRIYGEASETFTPFAGDLPFGLRFADSRQSLLAKLGACAWEADFMPQLRWDRNGYALFVRLSDTDTISRVAVNLPVEPKLRSKRAP